MFTLIIPVYNEQENLPRLFKKLNSLGKKNIEKIFINDASTDNSYEILKQYNKKNNQTKIINLPTRQGQGNCIIEGIIASSNNSLISIDADLQNDINDISSLYKTLNKGYDIVCGNRIKHLYNLGFTKAFFSIFLNLVIRKIFKLKIKDSTGGMKAFKKDCALKILINFHINNFHRYLPLLIHINRGKVHEIPILLHKRKYGKSKHLISKNIFSTIKDLTNLFFINKKILLYNKH